MDVDKENDQGKAAAGGPGDADPKATNAPRELRLPSCSQPQRRLFHAPAQSAMLSMAVAVASAAAGISLAVLIRQRIKRAAERAEAASEYEQLVLRAPEAPEELARRREGPAFGDVALVLDDLAVARPNELDGLSG